MRIDFGTEADRTYRIRNCRLIPANRELRQRAKLGQYFDRLSRFGIALDQVKSQRTTIETARKQDKQGVAVTISAYRHLDLDAETKRLAKEPSASPPVPLGPRIVAGEGEHPDNHTVVRILSPYQVCETQFLAYPPEIRGGVGVETGVNAKGETVILTYPLRSSRSEQLRFFNEGGGFLGSIIPPDKLSAPFTVCVGDFLPELKGDEIAVASRHASSTKPPIYVLSFSGKVLHTPEVPGAAQANYPREYDLFIKSDRTLDQLFLQNLAEKRAHRLMPQGAEAAVDFHSSPARSRLFESAFADRDFNLGGPEPLVSSLYPWKNESLQPALDAGRMENIFGSILRKSTMAAGRLGVNSRTAVTSKTVSTTFLERPNTGLRSFRPERSKTGAMRNGSRASIGNGEHSEGNTGSRPMTMIREFPPSGMPVSLIVGQFAEAEPFPINWTR